jgi:hypothetical protein
MREIMSFPIAFDANGVGVAGTKSPKRNRPICPFPLLITIDPGERTVTVRTSGRTLKKLPRETGISVNRSLAAAKNPMPQI